ncbi:hypothetical protein ACFLT2_01110 [Acidobacteriota bacterium]
MIEQMKRQIRTLKISLMVLGLFNGILFLAVCRSSQETTRFEEIDVERINIIEKDGTLKMALFNSDRLIRGKSERQGQGRMAGMLFYNEDGYECGGLVYLGKKTPDGQDAGAGLMFDQYRQDQTIALQHNEKVDSQGAHYDDGLTINSRPDWTVVKDEYAFYKMMKEFEGTEEEKESLYDKKAAENKVFRRRMFVGIRRGTKEGQYYDDTGLFIRNRYGRNAIRIFVDKDNIPHLEFYDTLGKNIIYEWKLDRNN